MPIFFDENDLTPDQRERYDWAVAEYARIQEANRARLEREGRTPVAHHISPKSALFGRLLEGKPALPSPPPTNHSYPWYDIIEKPGKYHVSLASHLSGHGLPVASAATGDEKTILLNQCPWRILRMNAGAETVWSFLQLERPTPEMNPDAIGLVERALANQPEFIVTYGEWGEFRLAMGRIIRRGRRAAVINSRFDLHTLDGGNPHIVKVLRSGAEIRAKADATLANVKDKLEQGASDLSLYDRITLASESGIPRSEEPEGDDLVEYDCDGWVLERL